MPSKEKAGCHPVFVLPWKEGTRDEHQEQHLCSRAHGAPRDFPHPSACACLPQVRRTQALEPAWPPPDGEISHLHPGDSCSLAHSSHWRAKLQENPWDGRKGAQCPFWHSCVQQPGETGAPVGMALLVSRPLSRCSASLPSELAPTAGTLILQAF